MRVAIDARPTQGSFTGDATYWRGLITGLSKIESDNEYLLYFYNKLQTPGVPPSQNMQHILIPGLNWRMWSAYSFPKALKRDGVRVAHVQYSIPPFTPCPVITSIHDVSFKRHPEFFSPKDRFILDMGVKLSKRRAARILALSEYTKAEICELYSINENRVDLVYPGVDLLFKPCGREESLQLVRTKYRITDPYVLTLGVIQPRKNLSRLLEGFSILKRNHEIRHKLVIVGKYGWMEENLTRTIDNLGLTGEVLLTGYAPYEDLPYLYSGADLFVYPSVYEGFGLPPLEAMCCGTPVITGDRSSLPEVVGDAGIMVDPYNPEAFTDAISRVLADKFLRTELARKGLEQSRKFTWERTARQVDAIYNETGR
ncbi:MAG: glycosyltransferase family 4 protein [Armatimonadota bacterium]